MKNQHLGLFTEHIFLRIICITMASVSLDILSIVAITYREEIPGLLLEAVCKTYISSLVWVGYLALIYVLTDLYSEKVYKAIVRKYTFFAIASSVIVFLLPIHYFQENKIIYTYGGSVLATYSFALIFVGNTVYHILRYGKSMSTKRKQAVTIWMITWIVASLIQFFNNELLLVGYASSLGVLILFFVLENPEANIDRQFGCFNSYALMTFMKQTYERKETYSIMLISFSQYQSSNVASSKIIENIRVLANNLQRNKNVKVFKDVEAQLMLVFDSEEELDLVLEDIKKNQITTLGHRKIELDLQPYIFVMYDSSLAMNESEFFRVFKYQIIHTQVLEKEKVLFINHEVIKSYRYKEEICSMIVDAIEHDRIEVYYQPIFSTESNQFVSAEALVRIKKDDGTVVLPGTFIEIAEEYGLIKQLGEIVFEKTCRFIKEEHIEKYGVKYMEINLSVVQCENWNLADRYIDIMNKYEVESSFVNLEITETASIQTQKIMLANMKKLIEYGVTFSLDDFGNGQSNLNYIADMPFHIIKLDMAMIKKYFKNEKARLIVDTAIKMVHDMGLKIAAEGVETDAQLKKMMDICVDYIQGYYFSKPLSKKDYIEFLKVHNQEINKD